MNKKDIYKYFKYYINGRKMITKFKKKGYLCRHLNFPSEISENLVRIFIKNKSGDDVIWNTKSGDLYNKTKKKLLKLKHFLHQDLHSLDLLKNGIKFILLI